MRRDHDYFWSFVLKRYPHAIEDRYFDGIELDFWPSPDAEQRDDGSFREMMSCHHDLETGKLGIYSEDGLIV